MKCFYFNFIVIFKIVSGFSSMYDGKIAGNLTLTECLTGNMSSKSDMDITTTERIRRFGYTAEEHIVVTEDGYLITIHRIPGAKGSRPVLLQHGILGSSFDWIVSGKGVSLVFLLADRGYDVWIGNARGTTYSRCHINYTASDSQFWDFSYHEMAIYDLPAVITYINNQTNKRLIYIGHSMGTTVFYVMAIERPDIASKVKVMFSFAPIVYLDNARSFLLLFAPFSPAMELFIKIMGTAEILSPTDVSKTLSKYICTLFLWQRQLCVIFLESIFGFDLPQFNYSLLPLFLYHTPAGTSLKVVMHYCQEKNTGKFQQYDHGTVENLRLYNNTEPPSYNLSKINVPIGLFYAQNDFLANPIDVKRLGQQLPNKIIEYEIEYPAFNHVDYLLGIDAPKYLYNKVMTVMESYH